MKEKTLGQTIAALRKERGMTQAELADQMNVTDKAVSKWERDLSCPDVGSLPRLAEILGISLDELMRVETKKNETARAGMVLLVCKTVALAMGVAVTVLSALGNLDFQAAAGMLGIGLTCVGIVLFNDREAR